MTKSRWRRWGGVSRREFLERLGLMTAVGGGIESGLGLPNFAWADEGDKGPIDCGPPRRQSLNIRPAANRFPRCRFPPRRYAAARRNVPPVRRP